MHTLSKTVANYGQGPLSIDGRNMFGCKYAYLGFPVLNCLVFRFRFPDVCCQEQ
jgi:hypothetical protein